MMQKYKNYVFFFEIKIKNFHPIFFLTLKKSYFDGLEFSLQY